MNSTTRFTEDIKKGKEKRNHELYKIWALLL